MDDNMNYNNEQNSGETIEPTPENTFEQTPDSTVEQTPEVQYEQPQTEYQPEYQQQEYQPQQYQTNQQYQPPYQPQTPAQPGNYSTAILVLGIVSIGLFWIYGILGLAAGIVGLVLANKQKQLGPLDSRANAGFICSIIGMILSGLYFVICIPIMCVACTAATTSPFFW